MITVSAAIVVYNEDVNILHRVLECFEGIELSKELIVVDNSLDDRLKEVTEKYLTVSYIHSGENLGFGAGHNLAFANRQSASDLHLVINPDTFFNPDQMTRMLQWQAEHSEIALSVPKILNLDGTEQYACRKIPTVLILIFRRLNVAGIFNSYVIEDELGHKQRNEVYDVPFCHGCFTIFRSEVFSALNGFDEQFFLYMEDVDIFIRAKQFGKTVQNPKFEIFHEFRKGSAKSLKLLWHHLHSAWKFFRKYPQL